MAQFGPMSTKALAFMLFFIPLHAASQVIECQPKDEPFSGSHNQVWGARRSSCAFVHAQPHAEGWVRAWARLHRDTGAVDLALEIETDTLHKGPCGKIGAELMDHGKVIAKIDMGQPACIGGKPPGRAVARLVEFGGSIPADLARHVDEVKANATVTGSRIAPFGLSIQEIEQALTVVLGYRSGTP